jgi:hypothetical protein
MAKQENLNTPEDDSQETTEQKAMSDPAFCNFILCSS